jgi:cytochrome c
MTKKIFLATIAAMAAVSLLRAGDDAAIDTSKLPPPSDKKGVTYDTDIKPIFDASCVKCHNGPKAKGKLHMDSLAAIMKGSEDGVVIKPGNSAGSMLVINIAHLGDKDDYMPPPGNKANIKDLTAEQIGMIRAWIDQGAK